MGSRAVIAFGPTSSKETVGIYLHWNGGVESVLAFLSAAAKLGVRDPLEDNYGIARIAQIIGNFLGGTTSLGVDVLAKLDTGNSDNGVYVVGQDFTIESRTGSGPKSLDDLTPAGVEYFQRVYDDVIKKNFAIFATDK